MFGADGSLLAYKKRLYQDRFLCIQIAAAIAQHDLKIVPYCTTIVTSHSFVYPKLEKLSPYGSLGRQTRDQSCTFLGSWRFSSLQRSSTLSVLAVDAFLAAVLLLGRLLLLDQCFCYFDSWNGLVVYYVERVAVWTILVSPHNTRYLKLGSQHASIRQLVHVPLLRTYTFEIHSCLVNGSRVEGCGHSNRWGSPQRSWA